MEVETWSPDGPSSPSEGKGRGQEPAPSKLRPSIRCSKDNTSPKGLSYLDLAGRWFKQPEFMPLTQLDSEAPQATNCGQMDAQSSKTHP